MQKKKKMKKKKSKTLSIYDSFDIDILAVAYNVYAIIKKVPELSKSVIQAIETQAEGGFISNYDLIYTRKETTRMIETHVQNKIYFYSVLENAQKARYWAGREGRIWVAGKIPTQNASEDN